MAISEMTAPHAFSSDCTGKGRRALV